MKCVKCGLEIDKCKYNSVKYCSKHCQRLYLKSQWKQRTKEHQLAYQREYRRIKNGGDKYPSTPAKLRAQNCLRCNTNYDLQLAHIKPLWAGGINKYVITLCRKCHSEFDNLLRDYWKRTLQT